VNLTYNGRGGKTIRGETARLFRAYFDKKPCPRFFVFFSFPLKNPSLVYRPFAAALIISDKL
jgi:hypothetical protein